MGTGHGWVAEICRLSGGAWLAIRILGTVAVAMGLYVALDAYMPVSRVLAEPVLLTPITRGQGFAIRYNVEKLRACPGEVMRFALGQGEDGVSHPLDREPVRGFRKVGERSTFIMRPYFPAYLPPDRYVIRTVVEYRCNGLASQVVVMDTAPVRVE